MCGCVTHLIFLSWPGLPNYHESFHITRNLPACLDFFEQLYQVGLRKILVAGTCYEYGLKNGSLKEDSIPDPVNSYAIAKDCLRRTMSNSLALQGLEWSWARIFYPYGVGQNPKSLLPSLDRAIYEGKSEFEMSSGRQLRDFICVDTVARILLKLAASPKAQGIFNCGSGFPVSLREFAEHRIAQSNSPISLKLGVYPDRQDEPLAFWSDMSKFINTFPDFKI